jgi:hypothetical protein
VKAGVPSRFLYTSVKGPYLKDGDVKANRQSRWLPAEKFPTSGDFTIVGDNIMMLSLVGTHPLGITVTSRELAQGLRSMFELAWDAAAVYNA